MPGPMRSSSLGLRARRDPAGFQAARFRARRHRAVPRPIADLKTDPVWGPGIHRLLPRGLASNLRAFGISTMLCCWTFHPAEIPRNIEQQRVNDERQRTQRRRSGCICAGRWRVVNSLTRKRSEVQILVRPQRRKHGSRPVWDDLQRELRADSHSIGSRPVQNAGHLPTAHRGG
jgi:hypothetical protein